MNGNCYRSGPRKELPRKCTTPSLRGGIREDPIPRKKTLHEFFANKNAQILPQISQKQSAVTSAPRGPSSLAREFALILKV